MSFGLEFFDLTPTLRLSGDSIAFARKFNKPGGQAAGTLGLEIGLTDDAEISLLQGVNVVGYRNIADVDASYTEMVNAGLVEIVTGQFALSTDAISRIEEVEPGKLEIGIAGAQPRIVFHSASVADVERTNDTNYKLPAAAFTSLKTVAATYQSTIRTKILAVIADYMAADSAIIDGVDFTGKITAPAVGNIVPFYFADQSAFPDATAAHGAVAHSHADGALYFAHGGIWHELAKEVDLQTTIASLDNEAATRAAGDSALGARLDVLEADPTTATAVAAVQADVNQNEADADAAIAAVQADVDQNESDADAAIAAETAARTAADTTLQSNIDAEATARGAADTTLQANIDAEATARAAADTAAIASANSYTDTAITNLTGSAPAVLDTLGEIAQAINDDANVYTTLVGQIAAVQSDVDVNEADSDAAIAAESAARSAAVTALQADVDQNEADADAAIAAETTARTAADTALGNRLDVLEADPTTQTLLTAEATARAAADTNLQSNIDAEATARANADALKLDASAVSAFGGTLVDDADAATARTTLGLGTAAVTASSDYATAAQGALADTAVQPAAISNVDNTSDADMCWSP